MNELVAPLVTAAMVTAVLTWLFVFLRDRIEQRRTFWRRRLHGAGEEEMVGLLSTEPVPAPGWAGGLDFRFERFVRQSGTGWGPEQALGAMAACGVCVGGILLLWRDDLGLTAVGLVVGLVLPLFVFRSLRQRWQTRLQDQLPDAYFLLARSLRAGENLEQALLTVAEHGPQPLAAEFRQGMEKIRLGLSVPATLQLIARRLRLEDFDVLVTAVQLHRTLGGNLALLLDRVAASARDRNQFRGFFRAATALGRITGMFVSAVPPMLLIGYWLWQPEILQRFVETPLGQRGLGLVVILELIGAIWLYLLLRVDY